MYIDCDYIRKIHHQVTVTYSQCLSSCGTVADNPGHYFCQQGIKSSFHHKINATFTTGGTCKRTVVG